MTPLEAAVIGILKKFKKKTNNDKEALKILRRKSHIETIARISEELAGFFVVVVVVKDITTKLKKRKNKNKKFPYAHVKFNAKTLYVSAITFVLPITRDRRAEKR